MKSTSIELLREEIGQALEACRSQTLELFNGVDRALFCQQAHPDFSPIGWHLGHIAYTEAYWILEKCAGLPASFPQYHQLFAADGLPKHHRQNLPSLSAIATYLEAVRSQVFTYLETAPLDKQERLWRWLVQHETQHNETIAFILQLLQWKREGGYINLKMSPSPVAIADSSLSDTVTILGGEFFLGSDSIEAQDNERPVRRVYLDTYEIDRYPVSCAQYREFMIGGGYQNRHFWTEEGWQWLQDNPVSHPLYWLDAAEWKNHPVCGVSYYEAEAYAKFAGKRLPTEAEWEKAASWDAKTQEKRLYPWGNNAPHSKLCNHNTLVGHTTPVNAYPEGQSAYGCYDMLGNVWEWTASWFSAYPKFQPYPYRGYSQTYFDNQHRVLRGGSWATRRWGLRTSFRNWYHPDVRQILVGFRCARS